LPPVRPPFPSLARFPAQSSDAAAPADAGDAGGDAGGDAAPDADAGASSPGDFGAREHELSLAVDPAEGLTLMLQSSVGGPRDGAAAILQVAFAPGGPAAYLILADPSRPPTLQLVLAPGQEGRTAKLCLGARPARGLATEAEVVATGAGALAHAKLSAKLTTADAYATLAATAPLSGGGSGGGGGAPVHAELSYHQALAPGLTAGGSLAGAVLLRGGAPAGVRGLQWGAFGSWTSRARDAAALARVGAVPRADGPPARLVAVTAWRRATKALELAATATATFPAGGGAPLDSSCGVGAKMTFEVPGGLNPVLAAHAAGLTSGVALTVPFAGAGSNTFLRTTASVVADHAARDYKVGANVEMYY